MKKLIIISDSDPRTTAVGGVGVYSRYLADNLSKKYDVLFIGKKQKEQQTIKKPYNVEMLGRNPGENNVLFFLRLNAFAKKTKTDKNTIIHAQRPDWLVPFRKKTGKKIFTLHGSHFKNMKIKKGLILLSAYSLLEKKAFRIADKIISVDSETKKEYSQKYPLSKEKIIVIPVGIDTKIFRPQNKKKARKTLGLPINKDIFLYVGRFSKEKNIDQMIKNIQYNETLVLVGKGEQEKPLKEQAKGKNIIFIKPQSHKKLAEYYSAADALLIFSSHEGLPTVALEAMACGRPAIATKVGELPNLIENGKNGFLVENNHRAIMTLALRKCEDMQKECTKTAEKYDWKIIAEKISREAYSKEA